MYKYQLYFKDMIGGRDHVTMSIRVDMTEYNRLYLPVQERQLIHPYSDADACAATIRCVKLEEALADKLKCLLQRRYCYDLFDLVYGVFVTKDIAVDRTELMKSSSARPSSAVARVRLARCSSTCRSTSTAAGGTRSWSQLRAG